MSEQTPDNGAPAPKKRGISLIVILLVVLIIGGGAGAGAFYYARRSTPPAEPKAVEHGVVSLEPFTVNLADPNASRFLRITMQLVVPTPELAEHVDKTPVELLQARSAILELLTTETSDVLMTSDGKTALKKAIAERVTPLLGEAKVLDVLFSDFVIQF